MKKVFSPQELNAMSDEERKAALSGGLGEMFSEMAHEHVTWIWWTKDTTEPTDILGHGTAFILDRGSGPMLVTAAHVYREYLAHQREHGALYCQVANGHVRDLSVLLIGCGNLHIPLGQPAPEPDIATFKMTLEQVSRVGKTPIQAFGDWPRPPVVNQNVMFAGFPGHERIFVGPSEINFGFHTGMTGARNVTDRQITLLIQREYLVDWTGHGVPPAGYGLGGISGSPLLVPEYGPKGWYFRLGGVVSEAPGPRSPDEVIFEMVAADRAEFILPNGTLAKVL
jgi:hypothetical protein